MKSRRRSLKNLLNSFNRKLYDLGDINPDLVQIYSPKYSPKDIRRFMTEHYDSKDGAVNQSKEFDLTGFYYALILEALKKVNYPLINNKHKNLKVLDVGCGFGSATFPIFKLFPKAEVIASELSAWMLYVFREKLANLKKKPNCHLLQLDAEDLDFKKDSFDIIVGAAILHHLFYPEKTLKSCAKILKPGGHAIFFEPFEEGTMMMALIYQTIIYHGGFKWLNFMMKRYFRNMNKVWLKMRNTDKAGDSFFKTVDDKWIFKRRYFFDLAVKYGFESCQIYRIDKSEKPFTNLAKNHFGKKINSLPKWIFEVIDNYENWLTKENKDELITEGCIIIKKKS